MHPTPFWIMSRWEKGPAIPDSIREKENREREMEIETEYMFRLSIDIVRLMIYMLEV